MVASLKIPAKFKNPIERISKIAEFENHGSWFLLVIGHGTLAA